MALAAVKNWVRNQPRLQPIVPLLKSLVHGYRAFVKPILRLFWTVPRDFVYLLLLPYRFGLFVHNVRWLESAGKERIRANPGATGPRRIVMLVNSDLRMDPRVQ